MNEQPTHEEIARLAYSFWVEEGSPESGTDLSDWFRAENLLKLSSGWIPFGKEPGSAS